MENTELSKKVVNKIKKIGLKPISKTIVNTKRFWFWFMASLSVLVGSISFSVTLFMLCNHDWFLYEKFGFGFLIQSLPYFWFVCLIPLSVWGGFYYRKTDMGYRHSFFTVVSVYIILTVFLGSIIHFIGMSEMVEKTLTERVPVYRQIVFDKSDLWFKPEEGLLSGEIVFVGNNFIGIKDIQNNPWNVDIANATMGKSVVLENGNVLKIFGKKTGDRDFEAEKLFPWKGGRVGRGCGK